MNVFIGGSRAVSKLNPAIRERLDDLMNRRCTILIGDANGADKAVQEYLAARHYSKVLVFCMQNCRNNFGDWQTHNVVPPPGSSGFTYYSAKDHVMAQQAGCGFMLWDGKSKGTLQNILNLLGANKRTLVYFTPTAEFHVLANESDLQSLLALCRTVDLEIAARGLKLKQPLIQSPLPLVGR